MQMTLSLSDDISTQETESWYGFADALRSDHRKLFLDMLNECCKLSISINSKGEFFSTESLLIALIFLQHRMIHSSITVITFFIPSILIWRPSKVIHH